MTNQEAVKSFEKSNEQAKVRLEVEKMRMDSGEIKELEFYIERDEMAIKALKQEPCDDVISRQATIEAFQMFRGYEANRTNAEWVDRIETIVKKLPPINPQKEGEYLKSAIRISKNIPKEAVLNAIHEAYMNAYDEQSLVRDLTQAVNELPPVNPQEPLTEEDYIELRDRFGDYVVFVVKDMISGKGERWKGANE